ncbi:HAMP domain-containing histidine kinase [Blautia schinkii]|nr:HAMP domain-containing histidine kinase [Blautia schinkii]
MKKGNLFYLMMDKMFGRQLGFRVRLFNVLASFGVFVSLLSVAASFFTGDSPMEYGVYLIFGTIAALLIVYSTKTGRYDRCYLITIILIFFIGFPIFFFMGGGFYGAMPFFFIFAIVFTIFMLEGKRALIISALELFLYVGVCIYAFLFIPVKREYLETGHIFLESVFGFCVVSIALGVCLAAHLSLYNAQQKKLDEQNALLAQTNKFKTEFLANLSHEMRSPLTVTSVNIQTAMDVLDDMGDMVKDPEAAKLLKSAQNEIMRLSRMVGGMLTLASMSESVDKQKLNLSRLVQSTVEMLRPSIGRHGCQVKTDIESGLYVFGNADLLMQVLSNLLQNSGTYTQNGMITVEVKRQGSIITITVQDTGRGIPPELLPRVFERGVSAGGTGYGLYLCKTVVESHGGRIWIEGTSGDGTTVCCTLPYYEGQIGGREE